MESPEHALSQFHLQQSSAPIRDYDDDRVGSETLITVWRIRDSLDTALDDCHNNYEAEVVRLWPYSAVIHLTSRLIQQ